MAGDSPAKSAVQRRPRLIEHSRATVLLLCILFVMLGLIFIPYLGIQQDEAMFATAFFLPDQAAVSHIAIARFGFIAPLMLMSYVGALKSWLYAPLLHFLPPSVYVLRIPVLLIAAGS